MGDFVGWKEWGEEVWMDGWIDGNWGWGWDKGKKVEMEIEIEMGKESAPRGEVAVEELQSFDVLP